MELADTDLFNKMSQIYPEIITPKIMRSYFLQIAKAIEYLHQNEITHNDIKLENILLFQNNIVKLADFGFSND